jgi:hypothetical protein
MVFPIAEGRRYAIDSAQGTPFIDFLGLHCVLKRTVLKPASGRIHQIYWSIGS